MTHHDHKNNWFLAQLKPNCAASANRNLKQQGFRTFLPIEEGTHKRNGRFVSIERPVFPGYIFVSFDTRHGLWRKIHSTYGIARLVSFGKEPATVPPNIMNQLLLRCDASCKLLPSEQLKPGDQVRLTHGPFTDFLATIETVEPNQRAWILMEVMSGQKRVAVNTAQVRAL